MALADGTTGQEPGPSIYRVLLKGFAWVLVPAVVIGYLALFWDAYSSKLGEVLCDGDFHIRKHAYNVTGIKSSYRFFCEESAGNVTSVTFILFLLSAAIWYVVSSLVWIWIWYGDYFKPRTRE